MLGADVWKRTMHSRNGGRNRKCHKWVELREKLLGNTADGIMCSEKRWEKRQMALHSWNTSQAKQANYAVNTYENLGGTMWNHDSKSQNVASDASAFPLLVENTHEQTILFLTEQSRGNRDHMNGQVYSEQKQTPRRVNAFKVLYIRRK